MLGLTVFQIRVCRYIKRDCIKILLLMQSPFDIYLFVTETMYFVKIFVLFAILTDFGIKAGGNAAFHRKQP